MAWQKRILSALFLGLSLFGRAQLEQVGISPLPGNDRLPSNTVNRVFQDKEGYIWLGTPDGLCRYDAYRILTFKLPGSDTIPELKKINAIGEINQFILVATDAGLFSLDKRNYQVQRVSSQGIGTKRINSILVDGLAEVWLGGDGVLYHCDARLRVVPVLTSSGPKNKRIPASGISEIYQDKSNFLWLCFWDNGLYRYDPARKTIRAYPYVGRNNNPFRVFQDRRKNYWICTWRGGLYQFYPENEPSKMYSEINLSSQGRLGRNEEVFFDIEQDNQLGYIWVMSFSGITAFTYNSSGTLQEVKLSNLFSGVNNIFSDLYKDRKGTFWISTFGEGVFNVNFNKPDIENFSFPSIQNRFRIAPNFTMLFEDSRGLVWCNVDRLGLGLFDWEHNSIRFYTEFTDVPENRDLQTVSCALENRKSREIWIGSAYKPLISIFRRNGSSYSRVREIGVDNGLPRTGMPQRMVEDSNGNTWIATSSGLFIVPEGSNQAVKATSISSPVLSLAAGNDGAIWVSFQKSGVLKLIYKNAKTALLYKMDKSGAFADAGNTEALAIAPSGRLWLGMTNGTIWSLEPRNNKLQLAIRKEATSNSPVLNIEAIGNQVWFITARLVYHFDPTSGMIREFGTEDGMVVNTFSKSALIKSVHQDRVYAGGNRGISSPPVLSKDLSGTSEKVLIPDVKVNNESVINALSGQYDPISGTLTLEPADQNIEIDFSSLNYSNPNKVRFAYKLSNIDRDWVYAPKGRQFVTYNNLSKGDYVFRIKASGPDNKWAKEETILAIHKKPRFYESGLAYLVYLLLVSGAIYLAFRFTIYRIKLRGDVRVAQIEKEKTEELTQTKLAYFTNISHDFLTPLTIISSLIDDLEITSKKHVSHFEKMRSNIGRLKRLIHQVLDFRKVESGNMHLKLSTGNLRVFLEDICKNQFEPLAKRRKLSFTYRFEDMDELAYFDVDKIDKITVNVLSNAFKYTPDGGSIRLEMQTVVKNAVTFATICITDTGVGIPEGEIENIFKPFYNNERAHKETNGIGLSLTRNLVHIHHGTIVAENGRDTGASFTISIPVSSNAFSTEELKNIAIIDTIEPYGKFSPDLAAVDEQVPQQASEVRLLLVEDNIELLETLQNVLKQSYQVLTAVNGKKALKLIKDEEIDIIVSDLMMPELNGLEFCRILKGNIETSHIPIILLTAKNNVEDRVECYNAGADGYISKPFDLPILIARINNFLAAKRNRQQGFKASPDLNISVLEYPSLDDELLRDIVTITEKHLADSEFDVIALARELNMSKSTLYRKIKSLIGTSPNDFIKNIRLKHGRQIIAQRKSMNISEIAYAVGFSDPRYFATCFKTEFGITPSDFQKQLG